MRKKHFKNAMFLLTSAMLLTACSNGAKTSEAPASTAAQAGSEAAETTGAADAGSADGMTAGTYEGTGRGMKGDLKVSVTVDETSILSIDVVDCVDTDGIKEAAIEALPDTIVAQQSTQVDNISGATMTSLGIKNAVEDALTTAGADLDSFRVKTGKAEKTKADDEEYDIVVVGGGMSGMSAAIEVARNSDASVLVLEKEAYAGGSSLVCGGGIWAINSEVNKEIDQDSTVDEYIDFMKMRSQTGDLNTGLMTNIYNKVDDVITYFMVCQQQQVRLGNRRERRFPGSGEDGKGSRC
jgi:fumarate reductase flavoprotein subunit